MRRLKVDPEAPDRSAIAEAAQVLRNGGIVAFPTETVYGICASARDKDATERLYGAKERKRRRTCAILLADADQATRLLGELPELARRIADRFWPGPVTLVVPGRRGGTVGLRLPDSPLARALARAVDFPLLQSSANKSGAPAALNSAGVVQSLGDTVDLLLDGGRTPGGKSSTVVQCDHERFRILRRGAIEADEIVRAATELTLIACTGNLCRSPVAEAALRDEIARLLECDPDELVGRGYRFGSFGTMAMVGYPATEHSVTAAAELGLDLGRHRSRPFSIRLIEEAARVYCLSSNHRDFLLPYFQNRPDALQLLHPKNKDIADPYGRALKVYRKTAQRIVDICTERARELTGVEDTDGE